MDELIIDGKNYVSSKRAAAITGYAKDYVGQLCREGRVEARLVGRSWYVYEPSIRKHRFEGEERAPEETPENSVEDKKEDSSENTTKQAIINAPTYQSEEPILVPPIEVSEPVREDPMPTESIGVEEIENAWQEWFQKEIPDTSKLHTETPVSLSDEGQEVSESPVNEEIAVPIKIREETAPITASIDIPLRTEFTTSERVSISQRRTPQRKTKSKLILKAVLIAVMLLSATIALIGIGEGGSISGITGVNFPFIEFLEGTDTVKNNSK